MLNEFERFNGMMHKHPHHKCAKNKTIVDHLIYTLVYHIGGNMQSALCLIKVLVRWEHLLECKWNTSYWLFGWLTV